MRLANFLAVVVLATLHASATAISSAKEAKAAVENGAEPAIADLNLADGGRMLRHAYGNDGLVANKHPYGDDGLVANKHPYGDDGLVADKHPYGDDGLVADGHPYGNDALDGSSLPDGYLEKEAGLKA
ncbi:hypothetical protein P3T76_005453 [Phytophthora citrophthora]|uniref:RxLR effector protein n=1 Tax=Phytophthora citrophthora TaxID=4793 RepID=A0AAD9LNU2_9STRA|nr:hypothetical protein P3T76_005453 [Phytophthora citrophthora]